MEAVFDCRTELANAILSGSAGGDITLETLNVSQNGTTNAPSGTAYNKVITDVPVPTLESKSINANGTYTPESGKAWKEVAVNIPGAKIVATGTFTPAADTNGYSFMHNLGYVPDLMEVYVNDVSSAPTLQTSYEVGSWYLIVKTPIMSDTPVAAAMASLTPTFQKVHCWKKTDGTLGSESLAFYSGYSIYSVTDTVCTYANTTKVAGGVTYTWRATKYA